jgi:glycosyltransferase involved in cell wall biosynthesis
MKLLYVVNQADTFFTHRLPWSRAARDAGWSVHVAGPVEDASPRLQAEGFVPLTVPFVRGLGGFGKQAQAAYEAFEVFRAVDADIVHLVGTQVVATLGPVARLARARHIVASITGLGHAFLTPGAMGAILRTITVSGYATTARAPKVAFVFQNRDDLEHVRGFFPTRQLQAEIIPGSGVDTEVFRVTPEPEGPITFVLAARLLREKGIADFIDAARVLRSRANPARLVLVGDLDPGNPSSFQEDEVRSWVDLGLVEWWGYSKDMAATLARAHVVVLPSFREGLPKVLLEAAAMARPLIATDVPGCRDVVRSDNGLLVPLGDPNALADAIVRLADDPALRRAMGTASRTLVERELSADIISKRYLATYVRLMERTNGT